MRPRPSSRPPFCRRARSPAAGSTAQKAEWLPRIARGEAIVAFALDEGARPGAIATKATRAGSGWRLDGVKHFVLDGHVADAILIAAEVEGEAALFLVEADAPGLSRDARTLVDGRRVASLRLDGVAVDGGRAACRRRGAIEEVVDIGRAVVSAALCGVAEEAFARTARYLKERRQFDRRIGSFQALQHRAARMHIEIENAWSATLQALQSIDARANSAALRRRDRQGQGERDGMRGDRGVSADARRHRHDRRIRHRPLL